jgi:hypothetical protein
MFFLIKNVLHIIHIDARCLFAEKVEKRSSKEVDCGRNKILKQARSRTSCKLSGVFLPSTKRTRGSVVVAIRYKLRINWPQENLHRCI